MLLVYRDFEWDLREAAANAATRDVSFREASTVFADEKVVISEDVSSGRLRAVGRSSGDRVLAVLHQPGRRIRILAAAVEGSEEETAVPAAGEAVAAAPEEATATPAAPHGVVAALQAAEPLPKMAVPEGTPGHLASRRPTRAPSARRRATAGTAPVLVPVDPVAPTTRPTRKAAKPTSDAPPPSGTQPATGWTSETYGLYWDAYAAARDEARRQGKSAAEAQRIGKDAGERAASGPAKQPPPKSAPKSAARPGSWRAAARALKVS